MCLELIERGLELPALGVDPGEIARRGALGLEDRRCEAVGALLGLGASRVVEYEVDDPGRPQAEDRTYRLVTTILEPERAPATDLAGLYAERWAIVMWSSGCLISR